MNIEEIADEHLKKTSNMSPCSPEYGVFIDGAEWLASKLPNREELARWYQEEEDVCSAAFDEDEPCYKHQRWCYSFADAILNLIENKIRGGKANE